MINNDIFLKRLGMNFQVLADALSHCTKEEHRLKIQLDQAVKNSRNFQPPHPHHATLSNSENPFANASVDINPLENLPGNFDVAFFWKQSDSKLYGRRSDMVMQHLLTSGKVGRILHFDAPLSILVIKRHLKECALDTQEIPLEFCYTIKRWMKGLDSEKYLSRQFIFREGTSDTLFGQLLPTQDNYCEWVIEQFKIAGFDPARTVAWVCPVVWDFPKIASQIPFKAIVADIIDDQRNWQNTPQYIDKLDKCYQETLKLADTIFTNCHTVADSFHDYIASNQIHIIPNGAEQFDEVQPKPPELANIPHPIIGYVGNLRDRIDWILLAKIIKARPDWSFTLIGNGKNLPNALDLSTFKNVYFLGIVEYSRLPHFLLAFDAAIIPHENNPMTQSMNPLKIYNYLSANLPVISTEIANIEEIKPLIQIANDAESFVAKIESALMQPKTRGKEYKQLMECINWKKRVADMLLLIDPMLALKSTEVNVHNSITSNCIKSQKKQVENLTQENRLLLLQLHQVQEELEQYYLKYSNDQVLSSAPNMMDPVYR